MLFGFVNAFISFKYQWTYIFIIRWISYGSHNLTCYYHCPACRTSLIATRFWVVMICPIIKCLTVLEFSFILFDLCLFITIFNFILNYVPIVTFWIFTYHKIWILLIIFCFIWSYLFFIVFFSPKMTQLFPEFRLCIYGVFITTYHHSNATSKKLLEWQWSVHSIATPSLPLRGGNAVLICIFATHSNATPASHSVATPKVHVNATPECTLHCHSITTTPMPLQQNTPMLSGVSLEC